MVGRVGSSERVRSGGERDMLSCGAALWVRTGGQTPRRVGGMGARSMDGIPASLCESIADGGGLRACRCRAVMTRDGLGRRLLGRGTGPAAPSTIVRAPAAWAELRCTCGAGRASSGRAGQAPCWPCAVLVQLAELGSLQAGSGAKEGWRRRRGRTAQGGGRAGCPLPVPEEPWRDRPLREAAALGGRPQSGSAGWAPRKDSVGLGQRCPRPRMCAGGRAAERGLSGATLSLGCFPLRLGASSCWATAGRSSEKRGLRGCSADGVRSGAGRVMETFSPQPARCRCSSGAPCLAQAAAGLGQAVRPLLGSRRLRCKSAPLSSERLLPLGLWARAETLEPSGRRNLLGCSLGSRLCRGWQLRCCLVHKLASVATVLMSSRGPLGVEERERVDLPRIRPVKSFLSFRKDCLQGMFLCAGRTDQLSKGELVVGGKATWG